METLEYIIILIIIHNSDKIFARCFTSLTMPKDDKIKNINKVHNLGNNPIHNINEINIPNKSINYNHEDINDNPYFSNSILFIPSNTNDTFVTNEIIKAKVILRLRKLCNKNYKFNIILFVRKILYPKKNYIQKDINFFFMYITSYFIGLINKF